METPIVDFVNKYKEKGTIRFHMPGHKGKEAFGFEGLDITEVSGADSLYEADGIIAASEANATSLYGFGRTLYSAGGSSQCIKAMLYLTLLCESAKGNRGRTVVAPRNAHRAFHHACALLGLEPEWIYPEGTDSLCSCPIDAAAVEKILAAKEEKPLAVYITSPDYLGNMPDIAAIAKVCDSYSLPLLVDNAHGAYLKFLEPSRHPVDLGAFMSADSAHKTLPVLTGGAYLQLSSRVPENILCAAKEALSLFGSSSPSYLILQSLDACNRYIAEGYRERLAGFVRQVDFFKKRLTDAGWRIYESDPLRVVIDTAAAGYTGGELAALLRGKGIECEYAERTSLVLMLTPENSSAELDYFCSLMEKIRQREAAPAESDLVSGQFPRNRRGMPLRDAYFSPSVRVAVADSVGRICARASTACPPAIPLAVSGEIISAECAALLEKYGIECIDVVAPTCS